jgi:hypothetical protein
VDPDDAEGRPGLLTAGTASQTGSSDPVFFDVAVLSRLRPATRRIHIRYASEYRWASPAPAGIHEEQNMGKAKEAAKETKKKPSKTPKEKKAAKLAKKHAGEATPLVATPKA